MPSIDTVGDLVIIHATKFNLVVLDLSINAAIIIHRPAASLNHSSRYIQQPNHH
jgi:hypothetical protein